METLPKLISLQVASKTYNIPVTRLRTCMRDGIITAMSFNGRVLVNDKEVKKLATEKPELKAAQRSKEDYPEYKKHSNLKGTKIWIMEASRKYDVPSGTITRWMQSGYIAKLETDGYRTYLDEADVAYCSEIYHSRGGGQGKWLFNRDGTPYSKQTA